MSARRKLFKAVILFFNKFSQKFLSTVKKQIIWLIRTLFATNRRRGTVNAGFVLPTVAMVALVVVLLTTAILFRSFERSKNASNVRVNEATLNAATPAIDRARAKLNKLFQDGRLPRATPADKALYDTLTTNINEYTFGDETQLNLTLNNDEKGKRTETEEKNKQLRTAWLYPVDTDNNGKFDSYTLYGIYFTNPPITNGAYKYARNSLEARTPPMTAGGVSGDCGDTLGTSASLVGSTGWFNIDGKLKKSFFAYTATVPITSDPTDATNYEKYKGNKGFSALEYQQERVQLPLVNNAVIYEDDINLTPGPTFNLNGRIFTNSNFLTGGGQGIKLYQVSSTASCFYEADNAKIVVGGNTAAGGFTDTSDISPSTKVHLFQGTSTNPSEVDFQTSVTQGPSDVAYNSLAYVQRINRLVSAQMASTNTDPTEVSNGIAQEYQKRNLTAADFTAAEQEQFRQQQLELYFKKRTRRVPFAEVPFNSALSVVLGTYETTNPLQGSGDTLRPPDIWIYPTDPSDGKTTGTNYTKLTLHTTNSDTKLLPTATEPTTLQKNSDGKEAFLGDRISVGNNLPQLWWNGTSFVGPNPQDTQNITGIKWDNTGGGDRTRRTRVEQLADLGATDRDGDWELAAAKVPSNPQDPVGGLRVVTGAGIYLPNSYTTTGLPSAKIVKVNGVDTTIPADTDFAIAKGVTTNIWSDMMPVASDKATEVTTSSEPYSYIILPDQNYTPYLRMRATVVYHYNSASTYNATSPAPLACVSSYYDPTNNTTANNKTDGGNSNNGIVYGSPTKTATDYDKVLRYQIQLKYPNGRLVNEPLKKAFEKIDASKTLTVSEKSAVDSALCALEILDGSVTASESKIPNNAITEKTFLDARQIKAIHKDESTSGVETFTNADGNGTVAASVPDAADYNLSKEKRQPLEIRATVLDIDKLRTTTVSGGVASGTEYLLPNSGIIYATRDDALLDTSATGANQKTESPVDYILDPTRRPNAVMLINGEKIWRGTQNVYIDAEKGLILASNLPVYVKGNFNVHTQQEFTTTLTDDWNNFYTRAVAQRNVNFACRKNDPKLRNCTTGDEWRPASVLADAVTLLSSNFREGFRNQGDYDLNDNLGDQTSITAFKKNGFNTNAYAINAQWYEPATSTPTEVPAKDIDDPTNDVQGSSYLNNFVTPVQRRGNFNEYLMEFCEKLPVSACEPQDWKVTTTANSWNISGGIIGQPISNIESGTTAIPAAAAYQRYPRRVAFERNSSGELIFRNTTGVEVTSGGNPTPLGIKDSKVDKFYYGSNTYPQQNLNALWFKTTGASNPKTDDDQDKDQPDTPLLLAEVPTSANLKDQPRLTPILQINNPFGKPSDQLNGTKVGPQGSGDNYDNNWLQKATRNGNTFNLAAAAGDTPARVTEDNGGLHNFVRFLENWNWALEPNFKGGTLANAIKASISGSFIQFKRSAYATGPFFASLTSDYEYPMKGNDNKTPFYLAPNRLWGYDVGLLSQSPDLFAQKLVRTPDDLPDEYFREVGRDDAWVKTLLCAKKTDDTYAIDADQRSCN